MEERYGITNNFKLGDYKVQCGQINKHEPFSAYLAISGYINPNGKAINKTMTTAERLFRIQVEDIVKEIFVDILPLFVMKDVQWSDSDHVDLSNVYSYCYFELTFHWAKNKKINVKKDKRFQLLAKELNKWLESTPLFSFVAKRPTK